jgi:hypothetical protein
MHPKNNFKRKPMSPANLILFSPRLKDFPHPEGAYTSEYWLDEGQFWYNVESPQGIFQTQDQPEEIIDLTPDMMPGDEKAYPTCLKVYVYRPDSSRGGL